MSDVAPKVLQAVARSDSDEYVPASRLEEATATAHTEGWNAAIEAAVAALDRASDDAKKAAHIESRAKLQETRLARSRTIEHASELVRALSQEGKG